MSNLEKQEQTDKLMRMQNEWLEKHTKEADLIECNTRTGRVIRAIYYSPLYKADEPIREFFRQVQQLEGIDIDERP